MEGRCGGQDLQVDQRGLLAIVKHSCLGNDDRIAALRNEDVGICALTWLVDDLSNPLFDFGVFDVLRYSGVEGVQDFSTASLFISFG